MKEHEKENQMYEQMTGYKRMRRQHHKAVVQLEAKCKQELEEHKQKLDKEYETLLSQFSKDLEKMQVKHHKELQKKVSQNDFFISTTFV
jgi:serine/threonine protein kinase TAO1, putative (fragment)